MSEIAIIRDSGILQEGEVDSLQEKYSEYNLTAYSSKQYKLLYKRKEYIPDLLVIDMKANIDWLKTINFYSKRNVKIAVWISGEDPELLLKLFRFKLHGYLSNTMNKKELLFATKNILKGSQYIHPDFSHILLKDYRGVFSQKNSRPDGLLTEREWDVLDLIVTGNNNRDISKILFISEKTVKNHVYKILKKLQVPDRTNAVLYAFKRKWFII